MKKLNLSRETLRLLSPELTRHAQGGMADDGDDGLTSQKNTRQAACPTMACPTNFCETRTC